MTPKDPDYVSRLEGIWAMLSQHMADEEEKHLPLLEDAMKDDGKDSVLLAKTFSKTKAFVPSRSHPNAGEHPPFETVLGLLNAPKDRLIDLFRKFPD